MTPQQYVSPVSSDR